MKKKLYLLLIICAFPLLINAQITNPYSETLDINNVNATVYSNGNYFWDLVGSPLYFIPADSGNTTIFSLNPWIAGFDSDDSLHLAAMRYTNEEFLPGPIVDIYDFNDTVTASQYNKIWKINREQIDEFKSEWDLGNVTNGSYSIPNVILTWPGNHPTLTSQLAPYIDLNQDGNYDPLDGDYPDIKGDQMLWWVYNDNTEHLSSGGKPLGIELRVSFYAYYYANPPNDSIEAINNTTFLNFEIVNRSHLIYDSTMIAIYTDFDIGNPNDDYIGSHVDLNSFYGYNGDNIDDPYNGLNYGGPIPPPPSQSVTLLNGPEADINDGIDNNRNGVIDEPNESWGLTNFMYLSNSMGPMSDPQLDYEYYNYMQSIWKDGSHLVYGDYGFIVDTSLTYTETNFAFPYDSDPLGWGQGGIVMSPWKEEETVNAPGDRRGLGSSGPFTFSPDEVISVDYALNFAWADTGTAFTSVTENMENVSDIIEWYENGNFPSSYSYGISDNTLSNDYLVYPNPVSDELFISGLSGNETFSLSDLLGREISVTNYDVDSNMINLSHIPNGIYLLSIEKKGQVRTFKVVKE